MTYDRLVLGEVRSDDSWLYIDVTHKMQIPADKHPAASPELELLLDGCPAHAPQASGSVVRDWETPSTVTVALANLPDGELDILVRVFNEEVVVPIRKQGGRVTYLPLEQRKGYSYRPGDPARGIAPEVGLEDPGCRKEEARP